MSSNECFCIVPTIRKSTKACLKCHDLEIFRVSNALVGDNTNRGVKDLKKNNFRADTN